MKTRISQASGTVIRGLGFLFGFLCLAVPARAQDHSPLYGLAFSSAASTAPVTDVPRFTRPKHVRGIHLTAWVAGSPAQRIGIDRLLAETELTAVVIDIKEYMGEVYIPGVGTAQEIGAAVRALPDIEQYIARLHAQGVYCIARMVVFKDGKAARARPDWAVKNSAGALWRDRAGNPWLDPYHRSAWEYNLSIAERAAALGFDEIQFDYIRFPSDGNIRACRYSGHHSTSSAAGALTGFLAEASRRLKPLGVAISIDVFGLTTTSSGDMGIGQRIVEMAREVDVVCPMVYPSHYAKGEYGIPDPDREPYRTVAIGMEGARRRIPVEKLRPWLQDFSLRGRYGAQEVRAQIQACYDNDIPEWLLWNPRCVYTRAGLKDKSAAEVYEKSTATVMELPRRGTADDVKPGDAPDANTARSPFTATGTFQDRADTAPVPDPRRP